MVKSSSAPSTPRSLSPSDSAYLSSSKRYKGVRMRSWGRWVSEIRIPRSRDKIWLGSYPSAEKAARAFDAAVVLLRGPSTRLNFPDCPPNVLAPSCLSSPRTIQAAAAAAASAPDSLEMLHKEVDEKLHILTDDETALLRPVKETCEVRACVEVESSSCFENMISSDESSQSYTQVSSTADTANPLSPLSFHSTAYNVQEAHLDQDDFQDLFPFDTLSRYGFTPISNGITVSERFDVELQSPADSCLWNL